MTFKNQILQRIADIGVVAVVRAENAEQAEKIAKSCIKGGVTAIEITYTVPGATEVIKTLKEKFSERELILGAGTVLDAETAQAAIASGATFIVSPAFDLTVSQLCLNLQIPYIPGCMTITEIITAMKSGAELIKIFPGSAFGPGFIKAIKGPLPNAQLMPTGGVSLENVKQWIQNGSIAVGVGGELIKGAKTGNYDLITQTAQKFITAVKQS
jgi:2-dehydro-3-deoxyphosphogluconate aldolase/(4S)-4-hydroxy-2-oxoglutarate aldolase